ncbi:Cof-type HAD-IIB family hydrolase [Lutibacter sp. B2]|nr:Cof-type HAD-IIB family hydrolase [Lutibacter sp. B2]
MMKYKAVISDLDGTLLNSNHQVSSYTKEVINKVIEKGIKFFIATGRHHMDVTCIREELGLDTTFITSNGSRVHNGERKEIFACDLDEKTVKDILNMEYDCEVHVNMYQGDQWFAAKENEWVRQFHNETGFCYDIRDLKKLKSYTASKVFFLCENNEKLLQVKEQIEEKFGEKLNVTFSLPQCLEIMASGVSKGTALEKVLKQYDIHPKEVVAFGDGLNDLEMLTFVGKGLVMGNAQDNLKNVLTENEIIQTNDDNGVANYLEKLFL